MSIKELLIDAPDGQLDASARSLIQKWDNIPTSLQVLEVLDECARYALASGFVMRVLDTLLDNAIRGENTTYEAVVQQATWRKDATHDS